MIVASMLVAESHGPRMSDTVPFVPADDVIKGQALVFSYFYYFYDTPYITVCTHSTELAV